MENQLLKRRLYQNLLRKSPTNKQNHPKALVAILKPKMLQEISLNNSKATLNPSFTNGKLLLSSPRQEHPKKSKLVSQLSPCQKLSKEAKVVLEEGKLMNRTNMKPHDIFAFYREFPEMREDFFYLNRIGHPYQYQIVTYSQRNSKEYMTVSTQGVTMYHEKQVQFLTQNEWIADEKIYYQLQKISFFNQYKISKNFTIWKNKMRRHYMKDQSELLNLKLFTSSYHPRNCLLEIHKLTNYMKDSIYFMPTDIFQPMNIKQFLQLTINYQNESFMKMIDEVENDIIEKLQVAINQQITKFKQNNNIKIEYLNNKEGTKKEGYVYSQEAILRKEYKNVCRLIKLADKMLVQTKIQLVQKCMEYLADKLANINAGNFQEEWIICTAQHNQGQLFWEPNFDTLINTFQSIVTNVVLQLSEKQRKIINRPDFENYRISEEPEAKKLDITVSLKQSIEQSNFYPELMNKIIKSFEYEFKRTYEQEKQLLKFMQIYEKHKQLKPMNEIYEENTVIELAQWLKECKKDSAQMQLLPETKCAGLLVFNLREIGKQIEGLPRETLNAFYSILPQETSRRCRSVTNHTKHLLDTLNFYPTDMTSFVQFNKCVRVAMDCLDEITSNGRNIMQMIGLLQEQRMPNMDLYKGRAKEVIMYISSLKTKVDDSNAKYDYSLSKFKKQLETAVLKIKSTVKQISSKFELIPFDKLTSQIVQIISQIDQIRPQAISLQQKSNKIIEIEIELSLHETNFEDVHVLFHKTEEISLLWHLWQEWTNFQHNIYSQHFSSINSKQIRQSWEYFLNTGSSVAKNLIDNEVATNLLQQIYEFEVFIDTICALTNPSLDEKSWYEISTYLGYELGLDQAQLPFSNRQSPTYTVQWLIKNNISSHKQKLQFIVNRLERQKQLVHILTTLKTYLQNLTIETQLKKRQIILLSDNYELKNKLCSNLANLQRIGNSQYSDGIKGEAQTLIRQYEYVEQILECALQFGKEWNRCQNFFESNCSSLKLLTKQSKQFISWETQWKKIIKMVSGDSAYFYRKVCDETTGLNPSRIIMKQISKCNYLIDQIKKGLEDYLEKKRASFPRYYFLTDTQLLTTFTNIDHTKAIEPQLLRILYDNIDDIIYQDQTITAILTKQQQIFELKPFNFKLQSEMEDIFKLIQQQIKKTFNLSIKNAFLNYSEESMSRQKMMLQSNLQISTAVDYISWVKLAQETYLCAEPIGDLHDWLEIQHQQIHELRNLIIHHKHTPHIQKKLCHLMSQSIYFREKTLYFLSQNITSLETYEWQRIPKLCLTVSNPEIYLKQLTYKVGYCYQLLKNRQISFITPETEKVWLNIAVALSQKCLVGVTGNTSEREQTIKQLGYFIGQNCESFTLETNFGFRTVQKLLCGVVSTGTWAYFNCPSSIEMLSFLAVQINNIRKMLTIDSASSLQMYRTNVLINPSCAFFLDFCHGESKLPTALKSMNYRIISLYSPDFKTIFKVISECELNNSELGLRVVQVTEHYKKVLSESSCIHFNMKLYRKIYNKAKFIKRSNYTEKVISALEILLMPSLDENHKIFFENLKSFLCEVVPNKNRKTMKIQEKYDEMFLRYQEQIQLYANSGIQAFTEPYFIKLATQVYQSITSNTKAVIISGPKLSGKSTLIEFLASFVQNKTGHQVQLHKFYPQAYSTTKTQDQNDQKIRMLTKLITKIDEPTWTIFDGPISDCYKRLLNDIADHNVIPGAGLMQFGGKCNIICETIDLDEMSPCLIQNHHIYYMTNSLISNSNLLKKTLMTDKYDKVMQNLTSQHLEYLINQLTLYISRFQSKGAFKIKSIIPLYPVSESQICYRCCQFVQAIFQLNGDSIKFKKKQTHKIIDKFASWTLFWAINGLINPQDSVKLSRCIIQQCKLQGLFQEELFNYIIYPGAGLEVQLIIGARTQSSILAIPAQGVVTMIGENLEQEQHSTKFNEQILVDDPSVIRVNTFQTNCFNYLWQLNTQIGNPVLIYGSPGTGKKTILQLLQKNNRERTQFHWIRFNANNPQKLGLQIIKPFRKFIGFHGIELKPQSLQKQLNICIEDVSLTLKTRETNQLLRMIFTESGLRDETGKWMNMKHCNLTLTCPKLMPSLQQVNRILPRLFMIQTNGNSSSKLYGVYNSYLKLWAQSLNLHGDLERLFISGNGDSILNSTISIYLFVESMAQNLYQSDSSSVDYMVLKPKLGDISQIFTNIFQVQQPSKFNFTYYSELWTHEVLRVWGDRIRDANLLDLLQKEIKKECLLKFKQNLALYDVTPLIFTSILTENNEEYRKIEDMEQLEDYIYNINESQAHMLPIKIVFKDLLQQIMKILRIIQMEKGHLLLLGPNHKTRQYLIHLASQIASAKYHHLKGHLITLEEHILPTVTDNYITCLMEDVEALTQEQIYQMSCLLNRNDFQMQIKPEIMDKIKFTLAKQVKGKDSKCLKLKQNNLKPNYVGKISELFMNNTHLLISGNPQAEKTKQLLCNHADLYGCMYINWFELTENCLVQVSKKMLESQKQQQQNAFKCPEMSHSDLIIEKVKAIYSIQQNPHFNDMLYIVDNVVQLSAKLMHNTHVKLLQIQKCLQNRQRATNLIQSCQQKQVIIYNNLELIKQQFLQKTNEFEEQKLFIAELKLTNDQEQTNCKESQEAEMIQQLEKMQSQLKNIKYRKDKIDIQERRLRKISQIAGDYLQIISHQHLLSQLQSKTQQQKKIQNSCVVVWCLMNYLRFENKDDLISNVNKWLVLLNEESVSSLQDIFSMMNLIIPQSILQIDIQKKLTSFVRFHIIIFIQSLRNYKFTVLQGQIVKVRDDHKILSRILSAIPEQGPLSEFHLIKIYQEYTSDLYLEIEKECCRLKKGIILIDCKQFVNAKKIEELKKILLRRNLVSLNRVIVITHDNPDFMIPFNKQYAIKELNMRSVYQNNPLGQADFTRLNAIVFQNKLKLSESKEILQKKYSTFNLQSEVDIEVIRKLKIETQALQNEISCSEEQLKNNQWVSQDKAVIDTIVNVFQNQREKVAETYTLAIMGQIYDQLHQSQSMDEMTMTKHVQKMVQINLKQPNLITMTEENQCYGVQQCLKYGRCWNDRVLILVLPNNIRSHQTLEKYNTKFINISANCNIPEPQQHQSLKIVINYVHLIHHKHLEKYCKKYLNSPKHKNPVLVLLTNSEIQTNSMYRLIRATSDDLTNKDSDHNVCGRWAESVRIFWQIYAAIKDKFYQEMVGEQELIDVYRWIQSVHNKEQLIMSLKDFTNQSYGDIINCIVYQKIYYEEISKFIYKYDTQLNAPQQLQLDSYELPFTFNLQEFTNTKDLLGKWVINKCLEFNRKLDKLKNLIKQMNREKIYNSYRNSLKQENMPSQEIIKEMNIQQKMLKMCLVGLGIVIGAQNSSNMIRASSKTINIPFYQNVFQHCIKFDGLPFSLEVLKLLQIRAVKKLNGKLNQVNLIWRLYNKIKLEDEGIPTDLYTRVTGTIYRTNLDRQEGQCNMIDTKKWAQKVKLLVYPRDLSNDLSNFKRVPIKTRKGQLVGYLTNSNKQIVNSIEYLECCQIVLH